MPSNKRLMNRLKHMYVSNRHENWTASKSSLRLLQMLHGGHHRINLLFEPIIRETIQKVETGLSFQHRGLLPSNLTILRIQPGENIQKVEYDNSVESIPTLKIIDVLSEHPHHHHHHKYRRHHHNRPSLISRKSSWHRVQHYYDHRSSRNRDEPLRDYSLRRKRMDSALVEPIINEHMESSTCFHQNRLRRVSVAYPLATA
ncbi:7a61710c-33f2-4f31-bb2a-3d333e696a0b-CDS [Sclerotinia trifoliorum]|uniref:7a61710c-33f2-4f31-bb2a-3d333e696a0b-CDS n=1 Tax=Sclerotinia trifoliorum TaxID=28548 RepID=A0A8H2W1R1_9HELO|nr:7a61710c-33f2-4f31-bb2a-3d333e696a0b-CDS [Sclerotinia trifoliorum]